MAEVIPFRGLPYRPDVALGSHPRMPSSLLAPPHDVIYEPERRNLAGLSSFNSAHLILPQPPVGRSPMRGIKSRQRRFLRGSGPVS